MCLQILNLRKKYGSQIALQDVNFTIKRGEIVGLLGPNGAGKSTLMKCLSGVLLATDGSIFFDDIDYLQNPILAKQKIGYLAEDNPLYKEMFLREFLSFVAEIRGISACIRKEKIEHCLQILDLKNVAHKKIKALSKGYQQRIGLAQAIIHEPEILILDEATNGLDPQQIIEIRTVIQNTMHGKIVLFSSHILQEIEALCQRIILLNDGRIIADMPIDEFKSQFRNVEEAYTNFFERF